MTQTNDLNKLVMTNRREGQGHMIPTQPVWKSPETVRWLSAGQQTQHCSTSGPPSTGPQCDANPRGIKSMHQNLNQHTAYFIKNVFLFKKKVS